MNVTLLYRDLAKHFCYSNLFSKVMQSVSQEAHPSQDACLQFYLQSYVMAFFTDNKVQKLQRIKQHNRLPEAV